MGMAGMGRLSKVASQKQMLPEKYDREEIIRYIKSNRFQTVKVSDDDLSAFQLN